MHRPNKCITWQCKFTIIVAAVIDFFMSAQELKYMCYFVVVRINVLFLLLGQPRLLILSRAPEGKGSRFLFNFHIKLDGVGPVDNRPSTNSLHHFIILIFLFFLCETWQVKHDMWLVTCDTWHVKRDMWHVTCDTWREVNILSKLQVPSSYGWTGFNFVQNVIFVLDPKLLND